jgi:FkbM family methyltransferase
VTYFSQRGEDVFLEPILPESGRYLDIGAYDGKTFSNTRRLAEKGWEGVCVEPAAYAFAAMCADPPPTAILVNALIGKRTGLVNFHYSKDLVSTTEEHHARKWSSVAAFVPIYTVSIALHEFLAEFPGPYDLISVDTEGTTLTLVEELMPHLDELETKYLVYEHDGAWLSIPGFEEIHRTEENAICVRKT